MLWPVIPADRLLFAEDATPWMGNKHNIGTTLSDKEGKLMIIAELWLAKEIIMPTQSGLPGFGALVAAEPSSTLPYSEALEDEHQPLGLRVLVHVCSH